MSDHKVFDTLRSRIEALPSPEFEARRQFYTDDEWDNSWELNGYPHQIPPIGDDWVHWTIIGGRRVGKTTAGKKWLQSKMAEANSLVILHHRAELDRISKEFWGDILRNGNIASWRMVQNTGTGNYTLKAMVPGAGKSVSQVEFVLEDRMHVTGFRDPDYIWADEVNDANHILQSFPLTKQFCFTGPVKLPENTILSQAGKARVL